MQSPQVLEGARNGEIANAARLKKSAVTTFYVYLVFLVCYFPTLAVFILPRLSLDGIPL